MRSFGRVLNMILIFALLLSACQAQATPTATPTEREMPGLTEALIEYGIALIHMKANLLFMQMGYQVVDAQLSFNEKSATIDDESGILKEARADVTSSFDVMYDEVKTTFSGSGTYLMYPVEILEDGVIWSEEIGLRVENSERSESYDISYNKEWRIGGELPRTRRIQENAEIKLGDVASEISRMTSITTEEFGDGIGRISMDQESNIGDTQESIKYTKEEHAVSDTQVEGSTTLEIVANNELREISTHYWMPRKFAGRTEFIEDSPFLETNATYDRYDVNIEGITYHLIEDAYIRVDEYSEDKTEYTTKWNLGIDGLLAVCRRDLFPCNSDLW